MWCVGDLSEIRLSIGEARTQLFGGYFVKQVLSKAIDSNQLLVCNQLVPLFRDEPIATYLSSCKVEVEAAVRGMEMIKMLADTAVDYSNVRLTYLLCFYATAYYASIVLRHRR